ncbi:MAG: V-type ATP synthase subunit A [Lentisphaerae bacterium]|jgi:V/A-type H+-transporting ATPase subunit A|nr:V-type ATP synthase subunit A [Lentisphaerota bacterium]
MTQNQSTSHVTGVNGNLVSVAFADAVTQNEVAYVMPADGSRLKAEVIRVRGREADLQVFESTTGVKVGDPVEFTSQLLSVELGPGLLTQVYDGLQNPLPELAKQAGYFLKKGLYIYPLDQEKTWDYTPVAKVGDVLTASDTVGTVPEGIFTHRIMLPFAWQGSWTITWTIGPGQYNIKTVVAKATDGNQERDITMTQTWPVKIPITTYKDRLLPREPLITQVRSIDTFFPVAKGGTFCTPGPFGAGKTVLQHALSQRSEVDIVIVAACGERAGEVVEILREFPHLEDPRTGRNLIDRTIIICNTSSMPVAAREASIYTSVTLAEYYRQMGLSLLLLADSTSRWAQALREESGRLEEIPGEEAFPAYLESLVANFYERAGLVQLNDGSLGSITICGAVSPAGGNFEEPVTQATLKVVGSFLALSRDRANARRYPAIHPLESWSKYNSIVPEKKVSVARNLLRAGNEVDQMMKVVGEEGTPTSDFVTYLKSEFLDSVYLQQNTFDPIDSACGSQRQEHVFDKILEVINATFDFPDKNEARTYFQNLRQSFIDWNYCPWQTDAFKEQEARIDNMLKDAR